MADPEEEEATAQKEKLAAKDSIRNERLHAITSKPINFSSQVQPVNCSFDCQPPLLKMIQVLGNGKSSLLGAVGNFEDMLIRGAQEQVFSRRKQLRLFLLQLRILTISQSN